MIVAGNHDSILMVEGEMQEVSEMEMLDAIRFAHEAIKLQCQFQVEFRALCGNKEKREYSHELSDEALNNQIAKYCYDKAYALAKSGNPDKHARSAAFKALHDEFKATLPAEEQILKAGLIKKYFHDVESDAMRNCILAEGIRLDGRKGTDIRAIWSEVDYLPSTHGSAIFTRGETQSLTSVTLGSKLDEQMIDIGYGAGYSYDHDADEGFSGANYWPDEMQSAQLYRPVARGLEAKIAERLAHWDGLRRERNPK